MGCEPIFAIVIAIAIHLVFSSHTCVVTNVIRFKNGLCNNSCNRTCNRVVNRRCEWTISVKASVPVYFRVSNVDV